MDSQLKLNKFNSLLSFVCLALILALPIFDLWFWLNFENTAHSLDAGIGNNLQLETIQAWQKIASFLFSFATTLIFIVALWHLRRIFENFKHAEFFNEQNTRSLYLVSKVLFLSTILKCLNSAVLSVLLTWNNGPGQKALVVSFGSNELWLLIISATFLTITWSFKEGQKLANDNAGFI